MSSIENDDIAIIVTQPCRQDEEHLQVVLKMRMNHCLDHHTCKKKFAYMRSSNKGSNQKNGFRNLGTR